ncbi:MAG: P-loop NTPase fold protein [Pseudomonadota bacterium]
MEDPGKEDTTSPSGWEDDVLERQDFAQFLTDTLSAQTKKVSERQKRGLTAALDADWGAGKTFFVEHWARDLSRQGFPVVVFDAWKNDLDENPAVALMAAIKREIARLLKQAPIEKEVADQVRTLGKSSMHHLRKALLPMAGLALTSVIKKATGVSVRELREVFDASDEEEENGDLQNQSTKDSADKEEDKLKEKIDAGLDKVFEQAMQEQDARIDSIERFKSLMTETLELLQKEAAVKHPMFVFVDELDRCRPSYAIALLEEIKHIFGMSNVCFVVSMNLGQLSHSVRAVYGPGFDAEHYLKRFFDQTFAIPLPNNKKHVELLLVESGILDQRRVSTGLPNQKNKGYENRSSDAITLIFDAFSLDLRSQKQVFRIAEATIASIDPGKPIYVLWLFFLCTLIHKNQNKYSELLRKEGDLSVFNNVFKEIQVEDKKIKYFYNQRPYGETTEERDVSLSDVLLAYCEISNLNVKEIWERNSTVGSNTYPKSNLQDVVQEMPSSYSQDKPPIPSIHYYLKFVRYAGYHQSREI